MAAKMNGEEEYQLSDGASCRKEGEVSSQDMKRVGTRLIVQTGEKSEFVDFRPNGGKHGSVMVEGGYQNRSSLPRVRRTKMNSDSVEEEKNKDICDSSRSTMDSSKRKTNKPSRDNKLCTQLRVHNKEPNSDQSNVGVDPKKEDFE